MQNIFYEVNTLDKRTYEEFHLSEDILMEHAANSIANHIRTFYSDKKSILIVCGSGNNGADGITLARLLHVEFEIKLYLHKQPSCDIGKLQLKRALALGIKPVENISNEDIVVDAIFGSGLNRELNKEDSNFLKNINNLDGIKIACDIPSGINADGFVYKNAFKADVTLTMGALKLSLFSDMAKENIAKVIQVDLGVNKKLYETESNYKLLDLQDLKSPFRNSKNTHKGSFGHLSLIHGEKEGAAVISALSALNYGTGLVTLVGQKITALPFSLMQDENIPENTTAIACGMGLGKQFQRDKLSKFLAHDAKLVLDADIFYHSIFNDLLHKEMIITPHPKEFVHILKTLNLADITVQTLQENRFKFVELFNKKFPHITLILKGANQIIAYNNQFFINTFGTSALAKGGSGDVLTGLCGALLAQGYSCLDAAIQASLAQTLAAKKITKNSYALTPEDIIKGLTCL